MITIIIKLSNKNFFLNHKCSAIKSVYIFCNFHSFSLFSFLLFFVCVSDVHSTPHELCKWAGKCCQVALGIGCRGRCCECLWQYSTSCRLSQWQGSGGTRVNSLQCKHQCCEPQRHGEYKSTTPPPPPSASPPPPTTTPVLASSEYLIQTLNFNSFLFCFVYCHYCCFRFLFSIFNLTC